MSISFSSAKNTPSATNCREETSREKVRGAVSRKEGVSESRERESGPRERCKTLKTSIDGRRVRSGRATRRRAIGRTRDRSIARVATVAPGRRVCGRVGRSARPSRSIEPRARKPSVKTRDGRDGESRAGDGRSSPDDRAVMVHTLRFWRC